MIFDQFKPCTFLQRCEKNRFENERVFDAKSKSTLVHWNIWCHGRIFLDWNRPNYCRRSLIKSAVSRVDVHITPLTFQLHWYGNQKRPSSINGAGSVATAVAGNPRGRSHRGIFPPPVTSSRREMKWLWLLNSLRTKQPWGQQQL